jgi:hypothetical protein
MENFEEKYNTLVDVLYKDVQDRFGPAIPGQWEFAMIDYDDATGPAITYPEGYMLHPREWKYHITLTTNTKSDWSNGIFQLSHETLHRLSPTGDPQTNNLEEGAAVYYSKIALEEHADDEEFFEAALQNIQKTGYPYAYDLVKLLLEKYPDAIMQLREKEGRFTEIKKEHFEEAGIDMEETLIGQLLEDFLKYRPVPPDEEESDSTEKSSSH